MSPQLKQLQTFTKTQNIRQLELPILTQAMNAPGADPIGELLSHLDAYLQFMRSGQFARAGQELEAINNLRSRIKGK